MNREFRFRGKRIDNGEWVYGDLENCRIRKCTFIHCYTEDGNYHKQHEVDAETIGQYTGLKDKDGVDIYEGDIVTDFINEGEPFGVIAWHNDGYFFINVDFDKKQQYPGSYTPLGEMIRVEIDGQPLDVEVIGNIYDNLELLKGGKE